MSRQVSRGSAGEDQADEWAGVAQLRWRVSARTEEGKLWLKGLNSIVNYFNTDVLLDNQSHIFVEE